ncbi:hypothetical protein BCEP27_160037 [Burkholderia cepacia]
MSLGLARTCLAALNIYSDKTMG